jgi:hypothetical protein
MAQVLAVPGDRRHGFDRKGSFSHDFGIITGMAVTKENNVLLCDYIKSQLLLFGEEGNYLSYLPLTSSPWDVAISNQNIAYVTMPFAFAQKQYSEILMHSSPVCQRQCQ